MREYNDEERRKYEENEHKSRMQKKERKELLEQLLAAGSTDTELIKDTKKRLETITKEQEEGRTKRTAFWQQLKKVSWISCCEKFVNFITRKFDKFLWIKDRKNQIFAE